MTQLHHSVENIFETMGEKDFDQVMQTLTAAILTAAINEGLEKEELMEFFSGAVEHVYSQLEVPDGTSFH